jgi:hypothetical protein
LTLKSTTFVIIAMKEAKIHADNYGYPELSLLEHKVLHTLSKMHTVELQINIVGMHITLRYIICL